MHSKPLMETEIFSRFVKGWCLNLNIELIYLDLPNIRFYSIVENPHIFLNPDLTVEDRDTLESIFLCREKLLNEIKVCQTFLYRI